MLMHLKVLLKILVLNIWEDILKSNKVLEDHNNKEDIKEDNREDNREDTIKCKIQTLILNHHLFLLET